MIRSMDRTKPRSAFQLKPILKTFLISGLFHGFYIGYYFFFFGLFILELGSKFIGNNAVVVAVSKHVPE